MDEKNLDIVLDENRNYILFSGGLELKTNKGNTFCSKNDRLMYFVIREIITNAHQNDKMSGYTLFENFIDYSKNKQEIGLAEILEQDKFINSLSSSGTEQSRDNAVFEYFEKEPLMFDLLINGMLSISNSLNGFLFENGFNKSNADVLSNDKFMDLLLVVYEKLESEKKSVLNFINKKHGSGIVLPLLLILQKITITEYSSVIIFYEIKSNLETYSDFEFNVVNRALELEQDINKVFEFLRYFNIENTIRENLQESIKYGETETLEFKSTLRWNLRENKKDSNIEHAVLKTINAFLNSRGGELFIGLTDDGKILGIETDKFENNDKFLMHLWNLIKASMGEEISHFVQALIEKYEEGTLCRVRCLKSKNPVFLNQKGFPEEFYIRIGPTSTSLGIRETHNYIKNHF